MLDRAESGPRAARGAAVLLTLSLALGCAQVDIVARRGAADDRDASDAPDTGAPDTGAPDTGAPPARPSCPYQHQMAPAGSRSATVAELVAAGLTRAICSCGGYVGSDQLEVDAFDRAQGPYVAGGQGGDVGVNLAFDLAGLAQIGGSLIVAGEGGVNLAPDRELAVAGDLKVSGPFAGALASLRVAGDAEIGGRVELGALAVEGALTQPAGATRNVSGEETVGELRMAEVMVAEPCGCAPEDLLNVAALVSVATANAMPISVPTPVLDTPCAEYVLSELDGDSLQITLRQSAAIYVPGNLQLGGALTIDTDAGAELDLFIAGNLQVGGRLELGTAQGPVRVHIGGTGTLHLTGGGEVQGALYAPGGEIVLDGPFTLYGGLLAARVAASAAALTVHYDRSLGRVPSP